MRKTPPSIPTNLHEDIEHLFKIFEIIKKFNNKGETFNSCALLLDLQNTISSNKAYKKFDPLLANYCFYTGRNLYKVAKDYDKNSLKKILLNAIQLFAIAKPILKSEKKYEFANECNTFTGACYLLLHDHFPPTSTCNYVKKAEMPIRQAAIYFQNHKEYKQAELLLKQLADRTKEAQELTSKDSPKENENPWRLPWCKLAYSKEELSKEKVLTLIKVHSLLRKPERTPEDDEMLKNLFNSHEQKAT